MLTKPREDEETKWKGILSAGGATAGLKRALVHWPSVV